MGLDYIALIEPARILNDSPPLPKVPPPLHLPFSTEICLYSKNSLETFPSYCPSGAWHSLVPNIQEHRVYNW